MDMLIETIVTETKIAAVIPTATINAASKIILMGDLGAPPFHSGSGRSFLQIGAIEKTAFAQMKAASTHRITAEPAWPWPTTTPGSMHEWSIKHNSTIRA
jgi:hypothetical protein